MLVKGVKQFPRDRQWSSENDEVKLFKREIETKPWTFDFLLIYMNTFYSIASKLNRITVNIVI